VYTLGGMISKEVSRSGKIAAGFEVLTRKV